jgi:glutamyl-tRNA synthetase
MSTTRVRFAPSPTGYFHVGSARTALFNWLFARQRGGVFVLRIEDTDAERNRPEWEAGILSAMAWLDMSPDEGPYRQSERSARYQSAIEALWRAGFLYACDCTREAIDARTKDNATPGYDGHCRGRGLERSERTALRFRTPDEGSTVVADIVRGDVEFPHRAMDDFVCVKSSGQPLFVLANVVDDRDMAITHVIRGEDLLPTTPKGILLWRALDEAGAGGDPGASGVDPGDPLPLPAFAHLPMLVNEQRKKLSKRRDPVAVESYRERGYLPEAFCNYLALLGWSPEGDQEMATRAELVDQFRLEQVHHAPAFFDVRKLTHMNGDYVRQLSAGEFVTASRPWVDPDGGSWTPEHRPPWPPDRFDPAVYESVAPLVQERVAVLGEVPPMVDFLFLADPDVDAASWDKAITRDDGAVGLLEAAVLVYATADWTAASLHEATLALAESHGRKLAKAQAPIRVAVTGRTVGPPLFESLQVLGREEVLRRLRRAIDRAARDMAAGDRGAG